MDLKKVAARSAAFPIAIVSVFAFFWTLGPIDVAPVSTTVSKTMMERDLSRSEEIDVIVVRPDEVAAQRTDSDETEAQAVRDHVAAELSSRGTFAHASYLLARYSAGLDRQAKKYTSGSPTSKDYILVDATGLETVCVATGYQPEAGGSVDDIYSRFVDRHLLNVPETGHAQELKQFALLHEVYGHCVHRELTTNPLDALIHLARKAKHTLIGQDRDYRHHRILRNEMRADAAAALVHLRDGGDPGVIDLMAKLRAVGEISVTGEPKEHPTHLTTPVLTRIASAYRYGDLEQELTGASPRRIHALADQFSERAFNRLRSN